MKKKISFKVAVWVFKNAEFDADFKFVANVA
jgi:hypothetical protein